MTVLLSLREVYAGYGNSTVLQGMTLDVEAGQWVVMTGRNGMGKTTTLRTIMKELALTSGQIYIEQKNIENLKTYEIAQLGVGYVPEGRQIFPTLTVEENIVVAQRHYFSTQERMTLSRIYEFFPRLYERKNQWGKSLSGGEQQMLAIGRALMTNPKLLILDEATEGLAPQMIERILGVLMQLRQQGMGILLVDKVGNQLRQSADIICVLERGKIIWQHAASEFTPDKELAMMGL